MSLGASKARLAATARQLALQWSETKNHWRDAKSQEFQARYLDTLFLEVEKNLTVIDKLDELLKKVRGDCE